jgi:homoserine kinase type II
MAVFTPVNEEEVSEWLKNYSIGALKELQAIETGIENTNYFVTTSEGDFVLTLFEVLQPRELPFYLNFMAHLANHGIACPRPIADLQNHYLGVLKNKPASMVSRLHGHSVTAPAAAHCARVGKLLANMHLAARTYPAAVDNPRGVQWWQFAAERVTPFLKSAERTLLESEIAFQAQLPHGELQRAVVHADLFRDNVLFSGEDIGGVLDFYFAGVDALLYDIAVTVNDWCLIPAQASETERLSALAKAYEQLRALSDRERDAWPAMLRRGALRFWLSRLYDYHLPRPGHLIKPHDPNHFRQILERHRDASLAWPEV